MKSINLVLADWEWDMPQFLIHLQKIETNFIRTTPKKNFKGNKQKKRKLYQDHTADKILQHLQHDRTKPSKRTNRSHKVYYKQHNLERLFLFEWEAEDKLISWIKPKQAALNSHINLRYFLLNISELIQVEKCSA